MTQAQRVVFDEENKIWKSVDYPYWDFLDQTLGQAFLTAMRSMDPNKVLEYYYDTGVERTVGEIYREAVTIAKNLQALGVKKGDVVVQYSLNNPKSSVLAFGTYLIGAIVNFFEVKLEEKNIDITLALLDPTVILYEERYKSNLSASLKRCELPSLRFMLSIDAPTAPNVASELLKSIPDAEIDQFEAVELGDPKVETASYVLTSGSTGLPKAANLSHSLMLHGLITWWCEPSGRAQLNSESIVFSFSPLRWISQIEVMFESILLGLKRICATEPPSGVYGRDIIRKTKITHFFTPPSVFQDILAAVDEDDYKTLSSLRIVLLGGEPPSQTVMDLTRQLARNCTVFRCYGMTEVSGCIGNDEKINGGKLIPGIQMKILDDNLKPVAHNERGQLCIKAPVPFKGYHKGDNSSYFSDGFFLNGDYGFMDENNNLNIESRYKDLIRAGNVILIPNTIEVYVTALPEVLMSRLVGYRKTPNDTDDTGALFVILQKNVHESEDNLCRKIFKTLNEKLSPEELDNIRHIHFVEKLPVTTCGKIDRVALKKQASLM